MWTSKRKSEKNDERPLVNLILARLKIVVRFYQVTYGLLEEFTYIKWSPSLSAISQFANILQLNALQFVPIHCLPKFEDGRFCWYENNYVGKVGFIFISFVVNMLRKIHLSVKVLSVTCKRSRLPNCLLRAFRDLLYLSTCSRITRMLPPACREL